MGSLGINDSIFQFEIIQMSIKIAEKEGIIQEEIENIFLQTVIPSKNKKQYRGTFQVWSFVLNDKNCQLKVTLEN